MRLKIQLRPSDIFAYLRLAPVTLFGLNVLYKYGSMTQIASVNLLCIYVYFRNARGTVENNAKKKILMLVRFYPHVFYITENLFILLQVLDNEICIKKSIYTRLGLSSRLDQKHLGLPDFFFPILSKEWKISVSPGRFLSLFEDCLLSFTVWKVCLEWSIRN